MANITDESRKKQGPDAYQVREAARGRWRDLLPRLGVPPQSLRNQHQPCPGCGGRDRFRFDNRDNAGTFICSQGGGGEVAGDGFTLLEHVHGWTFKEALQAVAQAVGLDGESTPPPKPARPTPAPAPKPGPEKRTCLSAGGWRRWRETYPITSDCPAGRYLKNRGCALPPEGGDIRWLPTARHWPTGHVGPALVALVTAPYARTATTLHLTWIAPDGAGKAAVTPPRLTLPGHTNQGIVRAWPDSEVTQGLAIAEGLESTLTVAHGFQPVWATLNAGNLAKLPSLPGVDALTIAADNDQAGMSAARRCADAWTAAGKEVRVWSAPDVGSDPNDLIAREGAA